MRVLVCGGRDFKDVKKFVHTLEIILRHHDDILIISGYDKDKDYPSGADKYAYNYAIVRDIHNKMFPYHYHLGKKGGSSRNQQMLDEGKPDLVIAFPTEKSIGTWDMVRRAEKAGIEVKVIK